jgi:carbon starvation protein
MVGESLLGLIAVLATTAGVLNEAKWHAIYVNWGAVQGLGAKVAVFIQGCSTFLEPLGVDRYTGSSLISLIVVSYALTSLDSATRLLRYNIEEMSETIGADFMRNRYLSSLAAVGAIAFFAFYEIGGKPAGLALWALFGTTNQLLAGLALLAITLYLIQRRKPWYFTGIPMVFLLIATMSAMSHNITGFYNKGEWPLFGVGVFLFVLAIWLVVEAVLAVRRYYREPPVDRAEVFEEN